MKRRSPSRSASPPAGGPEPWLAAPDARPYRKSNNSGLSGAMSRRVGRSRVGGSTEVERATAVPAKRAGPGPLEVIGAGGGSDGWSPRSMGWRQGARGATRTTGAEAASLGLVAAVGSNADKTPGTMSSAIGGSGEEAVASAGSRTASASGVAAEGASEEVGDSAGEEGGSTGEAGGVGAGGGVTGAGSDTVVVGTGAGEEAVRSCRAVKRSVARLVDETLAVWVRSPSSPGLSTRTVIAMLQPEHDARSGGPEDPEPQFHCQFHTQLDADGAGTNESDSEGSSRQFQVQFQTHVDGGV